MEENSPCDRCKKQEKNHFVIISFIKEKPKSNTYKLCKRCFKRAQFITNFYFKEMGFNEKK